MTDNIEEKIEKLLRVADGTANENESNTALLMAQKLADAYNLDLGNIGKSGGRKDEKISKGLYKYQRTLYTELAKLNHCKSWVSKGLVRGSKYTTCILGSKMNVTTTKIMADYVESVAARLVKERFASNKQFTKDAHLFREGVIDRMVDRMKDRRRSEEAERAEQKREQEARSRHPGAATENAIVLISDVAREEEKANYDYLHGEGSWQKLRDRVEQYERDRQTALDQFKAWELANPVEAAKAAAEKEAAEEKEWQDYIKRQSKLDRAAAKRREERIEKHGYDPEDYKSFKPSKYDSEAYLDGKHEGGKVSIDDQIDEETKEALS